MIPKLEQSEFTLFETLCNAKGMENNILFSPYSL